MLRIALERGSLRSLLCGEGVRSELVAAGLANCGRREIRTSRNPPTCMAIYHLSVKSISRAAGRSAPGAAAYRAGVLLTDERTGERFDYRRRRGIMGAAVVLPPGAPAWDRAALWNAAESAERRKDAKVAREVEIALPHELTRTHQRELAARFAVYLATRYRIAVDVAVHRPTRGDRRNVHAHLLCTTRELGPDGLEAKVRALDVATSAAVHVEEWRETWAQLVNDALKGAGIAARVDHRSYRRRGIQQEPEPKLGPAAAALERRGVKSRRGDLRRAVRRSEPPTRATAPPPARARAGQRS